jgi:hypothetical protein
LISEAVGEIELEDSVLVIKRIHVKLRLHVEESHRVFEGTFRIRQDVKVGTPAEFSSSLGVDGKTSPIKGTLRYQACDSKTCFLPNSVPVEWELKVLPLDRQRAPEDIRHK